MRLNLIFYIVLIFFALAVVSSEHQYRNNYSRLDIETKTTLDLKDEKTKLGRFFRNLAPNTDFGIHLEL